jgi:hypothetical protein
MNLMKRVFVGAVLVAVGWANAAAAAPVLQGTATTLTGINDLTINGVLYNATFVDGSCISIYGGCTNATLPFSTFSDASNAANAILAAIAGTYFDTNVGTVGCENLAQCYMWIPYDRFGLGNVSAAVAFNPFLGANSVVTGSTSEFADFSPLNIFTYVSFARTSSTEVPEPLTLLMFGTGLVGVATARCRKMRRVAAIQPCGT